MASLRNLKYHCTQTTKRVSIDNNVGPTHTSHLLFYFIIMVISQDSEPLRTGEHEKISNNDGDSLELALCPNRLHGQPILL